MCVAVYISHSGHAPVKVIGTQQTHGNGVKTYQSVTGQTAVFS